MKKISRARPRPAMKPEPVSRRVWVLLTSVTVREIERLDPILHAEEPDPEVPEFEEETAP